MPPLGVAVKALLCALLLTGCADTLDSVLYVDERFTPEEVMAIDEAALAWEMTTFNAWHLDLAYGARVAHTLPESRAHARREIVRMTEAEAMASGDWVLTSMPAIADTWTATKFERIAFIPERAADQGWTMRIMMMHEFGHHFGLKHIPDPDRDAVMSEHPLISIERFGLTGCVSEADATRIPLNVRVCP